MDNTSYIDGNIFFLKEPGSEKQRQLVSQNLYPSCVIKQFLIHMVMHHMSELALCLGHNAQGDNVMTVQTLLPPKLDSELYSKNTGLTSGVVCKEGPNYWKS